MRNAFRDFFRRRRVKRHFARNGNVFSYHGLSVEVPASTGIGLCNALLRNKYEASEAAMILAYLPPNVPVIELGGSLGIVSRLVRSRLRADIRHLVLEANPEIIDVCRGNALRGAPPGMSEVLNAALFHDAKVVEFKLGHEIHNNSLYGDGLHCRLVKVPAVTLADLLERIGTPEHFVLISDIEGGEFAIFEHEAALLSRLTVGIIELHPRIYGSMGRSEAELLDLCAASGLEVMDRRHNVIVIRPVPRRAGKSLALVEGLNRDDNRIDEVGAAHRK